MYILVRAKRTRGSRRRTFAEGGAVSCITCSISRCNRTLATEKHLLMLTDWSNESWCQKRRLEEETETAFISESKLYSRRSDCLVKARFETLVDAGYQRLTCILSHICLPSNWSVDLMYGGGLWKIWDFSFRYSVQWGDFVSGPTRCYWR